MNKFKYIVLLLFIGLLSSSICKAAAHYDDEKPSSKQVFSLDVSSVYGKPKKTWTRKEKGAYAERIVEDLLHRAKFMECPAKYISLGAPDAIGRRYSHPEQGIDGLFVKPQSRGRLPYIMMANESKFQWGGGSPKLSTMGCKECSGGIGDTDQMSWRWIHHSTESVLTDGAEYCGSHREGQLCSTVCPRVLSLLKRVSLEDVLYRTSTVVDGHGKIHFYTLYSNDKEYRRTGGFLRAIQSILKPKSK